MIAHILEKSGICCDLRRVEEYNRSCCKKCSMVLWRLPAMQNSWWLTTGFLMPVVGILLVGVGFYAARFRVARRLARRSYESPPMSNDFTIGELDQLCREGKISPGEFEKARASVLRKNTAINERANLKSTGGFPVIAPHSPDKA